MFFKVITMEKDLKGNFPVSHTDIWECERVKWEYGEREDKMCLIFTLFKDNNNYSDSFAFQLNREQFREAIFIENERGETIETFNTHRK